MASIDRIGHLTRVIRLEFVSSYSVGVIDQFIFMSLIVDELTDESVMC